MSLKNIYQAVQKLANPKRATFLQGFCKTGKGQYGEGDIFLGLTNPQSRQIAKQNEEISFKQLEELIKSKNHEERFIALVILTLKFSKKHKQAQERDMIQEECFKFYSKNLGYVNNWDLVDVSAYSILGNYLLDERRKIIRRKVWNDLIESNHLFRRRIAIVSTLVFIKKHQFQPTLQISERLLEDKNDLVHKGVGWMLREVGKFSMPTLQKFIQNYYDRMPRTSLRYAIEKFPEQKRKNYLKKQF